MWRSQHKSPKNQNIFCAQQKKNIHQLLQSDQNCFPKRRSRFQPWKRSQKWVQTHEVTTWRTWHDESKWCSLLEKMVDPSIVVSIWSSEIFYMKIPIPNIHNHNEGLVKMIFLFNSGCCFGLLISILGTHRSYTTVIRHERGTSVPRRHPEHQWD